MTSSRLLRLFVVAFLLPLGGCAVISSTDSKFSDPRSGSAYMLPKAVLEVQLVENGGTLTLRVAPQLIGDPKQAYLLNHLTSAFSSDELKIELDDSSTMLSKVKIKATDATLDILKELGAIGGGRRSELGAPGERIIFSGIYDPDEAEDGRINSVTLANLHRSLGLSMDQWKIECASDASDEQKCTTANNLSAALAARGEKLVVKVSAKAMLGAPSTSSNAVNSASKSATASTPQGAGTSASGSAQVDQGTGQAVTPKANCALGICHRALQPFLVELGIEGHFYQNTVTMLPNGGEPIVVPLSRAAFVTTEYEVILAKGQLKSLETKRPSSALALIKWPLDVYRAFLDATATFIQLRIGASAKEVELAQSNLTTATELKRILEEQRLLQNSSNERSSAMARSQGLLAFDLSARKSTDAIPTNGASNKADDQSRAGQPSTPKGQLPSPSGAKKPSSTAPK